MSTIIGYGVCVTCKKLVEFHFDKETNKLLYTIHEPNDHHPLVWLITYNPRRLGVITNIE